MSLRNPNRVHSRRQKRIAIVISNPAVSTTTGWPVGFWWSELTHPYFIFHEQGYEIEIFSPAGGSCQPDAMSDPRDPSGYSSSDLITLGFLNTPALASLVEETKNVDAISVEDFDALVVAGGQAPMFTYAEATNLHSKLAEFYEADKVVAALCHGVAVLRYARDSRGELIAKGKTVTGFANIEEDFADEAVWSYGMLPRGTHIMPWRIEDAMREIGANYVQSGMWKGFAIRDGNLITGQQNFSGFETAQLVVRALGE